MVKKKRSKAINEDSSLVDPTSRSFIYDEVDDYNNIDRDEEYDELNYENTTKVISKNKRKEHVLGLDLDSSEDEDDDEDDDNDDKDDDNDDTDDENDDKDDISFDGDIESSENEDDAPLEDDRTMGKRKKDYFGTDITDERMHNVVKMKKKKKKEEESLQVELDLARQMQKRIGKEKEAFQFFVDDELKSSEEKVEEEKQKKKEGDSSSVKKSKKEKKSKQIKESGLDPEVQEKCDELTTLLSPLIGALKKGFLPHSDATEYLKTRYLLCLNFLNNVAAKKMLERSGDDISQHPVEKRLTHYRQMYKELGNCKAAYEPELHKLLQDLSSGALRKQHRKMLGILKEKKSEKGEKKMESEPIEDKEIEKEDISDEDEMNHDMEDVIKGDIKEVDGQDRRLITYQIEKNKGLMPSRKKEQRNPRVKYKKKYQTKLKRRKGQVRAVRTETTRYGGEMFGIKANVIKSIKLK